MSMVGETVGQSQAKLPPNTEEMIKSDSVASDLLLEMVIGSLNSKAMPPRPIFEWALLHVAYNLTHLEHFFLEEGRKELEQDLLRTAELLASLVAVADKNKMFGLTIQVRDVLNARKLRYPHTMDLTYGGRLP